MTSLRDVYHKIFVIFVVGSLFIVEINGGGALQHKHKHKHKHKQREFGYFVLSLLWPPTLCGATPHCCSYSSCCSRSSSSAEFTIHGLWPNYNDDTWPACCTNSSFNKKEISTLLGPLEKYWPTLTCDMYSNCHGGKGLFWAHEWEKHGTCSFPVVRDEYSYFLTTLNVYFKHNVTEVLNKAGYVPSDSEKYPLGGIISAIQNAFHSTPLLVCSEGAVEELRLCFYKDFKPRDCVNGSSSHGTVISSEGSCPKYVSLPLHASSGPETGASPNLLAT